MDSFHPPVLSTQLLHIPAGAAQAPLTQAQQTFNRLLTQLEQARAQWQAWQDATQAVHTRYAQQVRPKWQQLWQAQLALAQLLDSLSATAMTKLDQQTLAEMVVKLCVDGSQQAPAGALRNALAELHQRYASNPAEVRQGLQEKHPAEFTVGQGVQSAAADADIDWDDPQAVAAYVEAQTQAAQAQAERARSAHQQQRQRQQAQRKSQQVQQANKPSVRAVYRKLASSLHPDREQDPHLREQKTALMQRVNQAYEADDLLALLELQWQVEQLDTSRLAQLPDAHLQRYNDVLIQQLAQLQQASSDSEQALVDMLGLPKGQRHSAHKMPALLRQYAQSLQQQTLQLQQATLQLQQAPDLLNQWLRAQR